MTSWTFYPAFIGSVVSVVSLSHITATAHDKAQPRTLSELGASEQRLLRRFRTILLFCGSMFAITGFGFIAPRAPYFLVTFFCMVLIIGGELLAGIVTAEARTAKVHNVLAFIMGIGMLGFAVALVPQLSGGFQGTMLGISIFMVISGSLTFLDKQHYIYYELPFVFLSHLSFLVAAIALR